MIKKLGRIISLLFRATSHIDIVREQNNLFYNLVNYVYNFSTAEDYYKKLSEWEHIITGVANNKVEERDKENIERHNFRRKND